MNQREQKLQSIVEGIFFNPKLEALTDKAATIKLFSLRGVQFEKLRELSKRLGTDDIAVMGIKDDLLILVTNLPSAKKWVGFKTKKA